MATQLCLTKETIYSTKVNFWGQREMVLDCSTARKEPLSFRDFSEMTNMMVGDIVAFTLGNIEMDYTMDTAFSQWIICITKASFIEGSLVEKASILLVQVCLPSIPSKV